MIEELSIEGLFGICEAIGIIATLFVILYFSRKQMKSLSIDLETKILNDLDDKINGLTRMMVDSPELIKVASKSESHRVRNWFNPAFEEYINKEIIPIGRN